MNSSSYTPHRGDIAWMQLDPTIGREQAGRRPVLVLSENKFTINSGLVLVCPITSNVRGIPSEVPINSGRVNGAVLPSHIKSVDARKRNLKYIVTADKKVVDQTVARVATFIGVE